MEDFLTIFFIATGICGALACVGCTIASIANAVASPAEWQAAAIFAWIALGMALWSVISWLTVITLEP